MPNFNNKLEKILKKNTRFLDQDGDLIKSEVVDKAWKVDRDLIELLLDEKEVKAKFFSEIKGHWIFNVTFFVDFVQDKNFLNDSYTKFKNKIGLTIDNKYLNQRSEVALVWPYKDCVLEGGMNEEETKRDEIFFNEILAQDEIDRLLDPKVLTNFKRYTIKGSEKLEEFNRDKDGNIKDNLLIKGNNLLALHSLKKQFAGKVDLIYIDPPYNTANDSFKYNDRFNHSTWLTFMKNRLEVAKHLLASSGSIFVHSDYNESHYLKILMDEVFGRDNFRNEIIWHYENKFKFQFTKNFNNDIESILFYSKNSGQQYFKHIKVKVKNKRKQNKITWDKEQKKMVTVKDKDGNVVYYESDEKIVGTLWNIPRINSQSKERSGLLGQKPEILIQRIIESASKQGDIILDYHLGSGTTCAVAHKMGRQYIGVEQMDYIEDLAIKRLKSVIGNSIKNNSMFEDIEYDQTGVSKDLNWNGGGEFVYFELKTYNQDFVDRIQKAKKTKDLETIWEDMKKHSFLNWNVDFRNADLAFDEWKKLDFEKQQHALIQLLNKNQLYVNLSEADDENMKCSEEEKKLSEDFYRK